MKKSLSLFILAAVSFVLVSCSMFDSREDDCSISISMSRSATYKGCEIKAVLTGDVDEQQSITVNDDKLPSSVEFSFKNLKPGINVQVQVLIVKDREIVASSEKVPVTINYGNNSVPITLKVSDGGSGTEPSDPEPSDPVVPENNSLDEVYVSTDGSDTDFDGTLEKPVASFQKALDLSTEGATIFIASDVDLVKTYYVSKSITIKPVSKSVVLRRTTDSTFSISGGTFTLEGYGDYTITVTDGEGAKSSTYFINVSGTSTILKLNSGAILDRITQSTKIINFMSSSNFYLDGGIIRSCTVTAGNSILSCTKGYINLNYGEISGNTVTPDSNNIGGIFYGSSSSVTLIQMGQSTDSAKKLVISNNTINGSGAGVYLNAVTCPIMGNVSITGNFSTSNSSKTAGLYMTQSIVNVRGTNVSITGNTVNGTDANVYGDSNNCFNSTTKASVTIGEEGYTK